MTKLDSFRAALMANGWFAARSASVQEGLIAAGRVVALAPGQWVYSQGDPETGLCAVLEGTLRLEVAIGDDRDVLIGLARPSTIIGQSARRGGGPRLLTVRASGAARVLLISDAALERVAAREPSLWRDLNELVYAELETLLRFSALLLAQRPKARLAWQLTQLATDDVVTATQADLAELTGVTRKAVNAHLAAFESAGLVSRGYAHIRVLAPDRLRGLAAR
ncbi:Crp/Fnr family transcriptional regulator [Sphingomonas tabacisoli]|uniref:Crp/Fnr family transcriptional regulator n=1 Tax=Sphingomonas tabacisoli TaxID=2249466 RepID=A0ABW4HZJ3_9SPHN